VYDDFCHANDPYEEHDFGSFEVDGQTIFFKIDHFDKALTSHSPDPADPSRTERVITIMLAEQRRFGHDFCSPQKDGQLPISHSAKQKASFHEDFGAKARS
jgi:Protein of unknown function (DUF3768)